ncbi:hypothetical protein [Pseudoalteromonas maricaloris]|uniref:hypothetical protein n=1 Tax=Pseudoalteromonas maricaloris TaxID=184924 RepID=UPI00029B2ED3|nr:hypothetical protein [Pseudoalteromonas flavipulchra]
MEVDLIIFVFMLAVLGFALLLSYCSIIYLPNDEVKPVQTTDNSYCSNELKTAREKHELKRSAHLLAEGEILENIFEGITDEEALELIVQLNFERRQNLKALSSLGLVNIEQVKRALLLRRKRA